MLYYVYFSDGGVAKTGLTCTWEYLRTAGATAVDKSALGPTISEVGGAGNGGGWYKFDITYGASGAGKPWDVTTEDLLGVIDGSNSLVDADRYKPVCISLRGLALARISHKGVQSKSSGDIDIYATDGISKEMQLAITDANDAVTRSPSAPD